MTEHEEQDFEPLDPAIVEAWPVLEPPPGFSARVLAGTRRSSLPGRWAMAAGLLVLGMGGGALAHRMLQPELSLSGSGRVMSSSRQTAVLGGRGVAVVESEGELVWSVDPAGAARVEQPRGNVFYRVDRGEPFRVETPAGEVEVRGTCFRVEVIMGSTGKIALLSGAGGAALATIAVVSAYEGRVIVASGGREVEVVAGQSALLSPGTAPRRIQAQGIATRAEVAARWAQSVPAAGSDPSPQPQLGTPAVERGARATPSSPHPAQAPQPVAGEKFTDFTPEELRQLAKQCEIRYEIPAYAMSHAPRKLKPAEAGISEAERGLLERLMAEGDPQLLQGMRAIYAEATGDVTGADVLEPRNLQHEVFEKAVPGEMELALQRISAERAGLAPVPADTARASAVERMLRLLTSAADRFEARVAKELGDERAHELRRARVGMATRGQAGCPEQ